MGRTSCLSVVDTQCCHPKRIKEVSRPLGCLSRSPTTLKILFYRPPRLDRGTVVADPQATPLWRMPFALRFAIVSLADTWLVSHGVYSS